MFVLVEIVKWTPPLQALRNTVKPLPEENSFGCIICSVLIIHFRTDPRTAFDQELRSKDHVPSRCKSGYMEVMSRSADSD